MVLFISLEPNSLEIIGTYSDCNGFYRGTIANISRYEERKIKLYRRNKALV
jgi:hypothetical protein